MRTLHNLHALDIKVGQVGSTVRLGGKWADLDTDDQFELCVCTKDPEAPDDVARQTHDVQGMGVVLDLWFGRFLDIPARLLKYEHEERSREYDGLQDSMVNAYGDAFDPTRAVVVIIYSRQA
jgi:hypothetical protein